MFCRVNAIFLLDLIQWLGNGAEKIYLETTPAGRAVYECAGFVDMSDMMELDDLRWSFANNACGDAMWSFL